MENKDLIGYENMYTISVNGKITNKRTKRILKHNLDGRGYLFVALYTKKIERSQHRVHRLLAINFIPNPNNKPNINHINGIKTDNRLENLEWCTQKENVHHAWENGIAKTNGMEVIDTITGIIYRSKTKASEAIGMDYMKLHYMLNGIKENTTNMKYYEAV